MATIPKQGPIDLSVIRDAINAAGGHATNDLMSFFSAENIAEGSPRKPIVLAQDFAQDFDSTKPNYSPNFWQDGGRYGWIMDGAKVTNSNSPFLDVFNKYDGDMNGWQRSLPTGGASSPYRLGDFLGYVSHAEKLAENFHVTPNSDTHWIEDNELLIFAIDTPSEDSDSVELTEIDPLKGYYLGLIFKNAGGIKHVSNTETTDGIRSSVAIRTSTLGVGIYEVEPFLSKKPISFSANNSVSGATGIVAYTLPNITPITVRILPREVVEGDLVFVSATVAIERRSGADAIIYSLTIKNNSSVAQTISDAQLALCYAYDGSEIRTIYIPSFNVPAKGQYTQTATEVQTGYLPTPPDGFTAKIYFSEYIESVEGIEVKDNRNI